MVIFKIRGTCEIGIQKSFVSLHLGLLEVRESFHWH